MKTWLVYTGRIRDANFKTAVERTWNKGVGGGRTLSRWFLRHRSCTDVRDNAIITRNKQSL